MSTSADLGVPFVASNQATPEITHNEALYLLQALLNGVIDKGRNTPPGSPTEGDSYILGSSPTGDWSGRANCIAIRTNGGWRFMPGNNSAGTPIAMGSRQKGMHVWVRDLGGSPITGALYVWSAAAWVMVPGTQI